MAVSTVVRIRQTRGWWGGSELVDLDPFMMAAAAADDTCAYIS